MQSKLLKAIIVGFLFILLGLVRVFENDLFYDPFIKFYKQLYFTQEVPNFNLTKLITHTLFRYLLNSIISITILYIAFNKKDILRFSTIFYSIIFLLLISCYTITITNFSEELYLIFFYIRRFLIQPIFILLLLPAFYYQRIITKKH